MAMPLEMRTSWQGEGAGPVTIAGAGPAGLACAIALARAGRTVIVRELRRDVGARFHDDFQGIENWSDEQDVIDELTAAGIEARFEHHPVMRGTVCDSRGNIYPVRSRRPLFYMVRRGAAEGCLDRSLLRQAVAAGVDVRFGERAGAGATVLATGPTIAHVIAAGYVFETDMPDGSWLLLDNEVAPLGYAYLLVHRGRGTVATCMFTGFKQRAEYVERTIAAFRKLAGLDMRNQRRFGGIGNFRLPQTAMQDGRPVVGEQAGFQDALAGFGIRYAIRSGLLAARSILEGKDYTSLWRHDLLPLLRVGTVNRFIFGLVGDSGRRSAARMLRGGDAGAVLRRFYRPSIFSRALFPLARLYWPARPDRG